MSLLLKEGNTWKILAKPTCLPGAHGSSVENESTNKHADIPGGQRQEQEVLTDMWAVQPLALHAQKILTLH